MISRPEMATIAEDLRPTLIAYAVSLGQSLEDAEDMTHDALLAFWRVYERGRKPLNLGVQILKNSIYNRTVALSRQQSNAPHIPIPPPTDCPLESMILSEHTKSLYHRVDTVLRGREHTIVRLWLAGERPKDIAETTGMKLRAVYRILTEARGKLGSVV